MWDDNSDDNSDGESDGIVVIVAVTTDIVLCVRIGRRLARDESMRDGGG